MTVASRRDNLKGIMRAELPVAVSKGTIESIIGLNETNYELNLDQDSRILTLENNETIYQVFSYVGTSASGQIPVYQESSIFDIYGDGLVDAIAVKADGNQNPLEEIVTDSTGAQITVTSLIDNLDTTANFTLSGTPTENACIIYFLKIKDEFKANIPEDNIIPPAINVPSTSLNVLLVAKAGGDFTSVKDAIDSITDNDELHRYLISVAPGIYTEDNPIQGKSYVNIEAQGMHTVRIVAGNPNQDLFLGTHLFYLIGFSFVDVVGANNYAVNHSVPGEMVIKDCVFTDCSNGVLVNNASSLMNILDCALYTPIIVNMQKGVSVLAGNVTISFLKVVTNSTMDIMLNVDGTDATVLPDTIQTASPNVNIAFNIDNDASVAGFGIKLIAMTDGMVISGTGTSVKLNTLQILAAQNDGFRIENVGTDISVALFATTVSLCAGLNFNILNPNSATVGNGLTEIENSFLVSGAEFVTYLIDVTEGDKGLHIFGELKVGSVENPAESSLGEGDSTVRGMKVFTYDGSSYVDVTTAAKSASGSTFTFPNLLVNSAIYIASELIQSGDYYKHHGIKALVSTVAIGGVIVMEYWNGGVWVEENASQIQSGGKYFPFAKQYFQQIGSYQIRYNPALVNDDWAANDVMAYGTNLYWVRFRITSQLTTAPIFEQWKYHTSRFEPNGDGFIEYNGKARPIGQLSINIGSAKPIEGNMQSQSVYISENIGVGYVTNKFTTTSDILGFSGRIPFNIDTSAPINLIWSGLFNTSHTPTFTVRWGWVSPGSTLYTTEPGQVNNYNSLTVSRAVILNLNEVFQADLDISDMIARRDGSFGDELWISIQMTTLTGTFSITTGTADYTKWCEGGHI